MAFKAKSLIRIRFIVLFLFSKALFSCRFLLYCSQSFVTSNNANSIKQTQPQNLFILLLQQRGIHFLISQGYFSRLFDFFCSKKSYQIKAESKKGTKQ